MSVVIAVRDGERYLGEALDSILGQEPPPGEVVVVDDGSRDGTAELLAAYGAALHVIHQEPLGQAAATNRGIAAASREYLAFLDADDRWAPTSLAVRGARMAADDAPDAVFGRVVQFVSPELPDEVKRRFRFDPAPPRAHLFPAMLVRRAAFLRVGMLDESLPSACNIDWYSRARTAGIHSVEIDDVVSFRRLHRTNVGVTLDREVTLQALRDVVRAHHARRDDGAPTTPVEG